MVARGTAACGALAFLLAASACGGDVRVTDDGAGGEGPSGSGGSATELSVWPGQTGSMVNCNNDGAQLLIEIWPVEGAAACLGSGGIDGSKVLFILVDNWDGGSGVFALEQTSLHGTAHAMLGGENASGSFTLEPFTDVPGVISWDLDFAEGSTDLSLCFVPPEEPCATPD